MSYETICETFFDQNTGADTIPIIPPRVDPVRPPQRNDANCPYSGEWVYMYNDSSDESDNGGSPMLRSTHVDTGIGDGYLADDDSEYDDRSEISGEEGAEEHLLVHVEHHGFVSVAAILRALRQLRRDGVLSGHVDEVDRTLSASSSGIWSPSSMVVEHPSADHSMASSHVHSIRAPSPTLFTLMSGAFEFQQDAGALSGSLFTAHGPIWLTPEPLSTVEGEDKRTL